MIQPTTRPRKRFGQHFLHDQSVVQRIIDAVDPAGGRPLLEIGPGRGALTYPLIQRVDHLDVIEIDRDLAGALQANCPAPEKLTVYNSDALKFDFRSHAAGQKLRILGNLPYNISTPLLFHLLDYADCIDEMIFMVQKEVAGRLCASVGTREYGRLTIMIQSCCRVETLFNVGTGAFTPAPKVESTVIRLAPLPENIFLKTDRPLFGLIIRTAFSHRRKTLRNALKGLVPANIYAGLGIPAAARPQDLTVADYVKLANALHEDKLE